MAGSASDVLVIGGGIIGLSIAREAARAGLSVRLLERGEPGGEASSAAAGMIGPQLHAEMAGPALSLALQSRDLYPEFVGALRDESGIDAGLSARGILVVARDEREAGLLERGAAFQRGLGLSAEAVRAGDLTRLEPALAGDLAGGLLLPRDWSLDNVRLLNALHIAALRAGVDVRPGVMATKVLRDGGRVAGVEATEGRFSAGAVVVAAGAWSGAVGLDGATPLRTHPVRGQIACLRTAAPLLADALVTEGCYLVPRADGRLLIGSTMERVGFDRTVTAEAIAALLETAFRLVPAARRAALHSTWVGFRPAVGDPLPAIGRGPLPGLFYACGHLREGLLLAPVTARVVTRLLRGEAPGIDLEPFSPLRFSVGETGARRDTA
jgi:glycine oxidase